MATKISHGSIKTIISLLVEKGSMGLLDKLSPKKRIVAGIVGLIVLYVLWDKYLRGDTAGDESKTGPAQEDDAESENSPAQEDDAELEQLKKNLVSWGKVLQQHPMVKNYACQIGANKSGFCKTCLPGYNGKYCGSGGCVCVRDGTHGPCIDKINKLLMDSSKATHKDAEQCGPYLQQLVDISGKIKTN